MGPHESPPPNRHGCDEKPLKGVSGHCGTYLEVSAAAMQRTLAGPEPTGPWQCHTLVPGTPRQREKAGEAALTPDIRGMERQVTAEAGPGTHAAARALSVVS